MNRRPFLPYLVTPAVAASLQRAAALSGPAPAMKITGIDSTYWRSGSDLPWKPNWVWVRVQTDSGLIGQGETCPRNEAEASVVHSTIAGLLLGRELIDRYGIEAIKIWPFDRAALPILPLRSGRTGRHLSGSASRAVAT